MKKALLLILIVLVVAGWAWVSPRLAAKRFRDAAIAGDTKTLNQIVDFAAVREHLKADIAAGLAGRVPQGPLGAAAAGLTAQQLLDRYVTPAGIAALARYAGSGPSTSPVQVELLDMGYRDLSDFGVTMGARQRAQDKVTFVFHRSGLSWRLDRVLLPNFTQH